MIWAVALLGLIVVATIPLQREAGKVDPASMRDAAPGQFAQLSDGVTHYQWLGPVRGPVVVAVHGLTTPSPVFYAVAAGLADHGYRVLVYDQFGRGYSDSPKAEQTEDFHVRQLTELIAHLKLSEDITLMGYSMGGAIATAFAAVRPGVLRQLILLAPVGMRIRSDGFDRFCERVPFLGDWLFDIVGEARARKRLRSRLGQPFDVEGILELQLAEFAGKGFNRAVLSSRRHMLTRSFEWHHRQVAGHDIPVVAIWAEQDEVIPLSSLGLLAQWNRSAKQEVVSGAGHDFLVTRAEEVTALLRSVLREPD